MRTYYMNDYKPPKDIDSIEKVKDYQKRLGVKADGIWGPKTQSAYDAQKNNGSGYGTDYANAGASQSLTSGTAKNAHSIKAVKTDPLQGDDDAGALAASLKRMNRSNKQTAGYGATKSGKTSAAPAYAPPLGLRRPDQIRTMQRIVGVKDDGIWGPKTQEAYEAWQNNNGNLRSGAIGPIRPKQENPARETDAPAYAPPLGLRRPDQIRTMQRIVGAKDDGIWGPKTQEAYEKWSAELQEGSRSSTDETADREPQATGSEGWHDGEKSTEETTKKKEEATAEAGWIIHKSSKSYKEKEALWKIIEIGAGAGFSAADLCKLAVGLVGGTLVASAPTGGAGGAAVVASIVPRLAKKTYDTTSKVARLIAAIDNYIKYKEFDETYYTRFDTGTYLDELLASHVEIN
ncbi:MAG: peptidoglycan-binding domain-containing protein [Clostridia bacterium]|nr:peptidoglycan-binding domain-containing protein [Clostridia bacterium]